jgi:hypothetical protein
MDIIRNFNIRYSWNDWRTYSVFIPGISCLIQYHRINHPKKLKMYKNYGSLNKVCFWYLLGGISQMLGSLLMIFKTDWIYPNSVILFLSTFQVIHLIYRRYAM